MHNAAIHLRAHPEQRDLIDQAARLLHKNRSDFMLEAICAGAGFDGGELGGDFELTFVKRGATRRRKANLSYSCQHIRNDGIRMPMTQAMLRLQPRNHLHVLHVFEATNEV